MNTITQSLIWAGVIIAAAVLCKSVGLSDAGSFAMVSGLVGAAWASIHAGRRRGCAKRGC